MGETGRPDGELLAAWFRQKETAAFEELYRRYGALVYSACLRRLRDPAEAEDAAAAVFLILERKAGGLLGSRSLAGWLQWCAFNVARKAAWLRAARAEREKEAAQMQMQMREEDGPAWQAAVPNLDAALAELPASQRDVIVLHYLQGRSRSQVAAELHLPEGTVAKRARLGLEKLRARLARDGAALSVAALATALSQSVSTQELPVGLTSKISALLAGGTPGGKVSVIAEGTMKAMVWMQIKLVAAVLFGALLLAGAGGALWKLEAGEAAQAPAEKAVASWPAWRMALKPRTVTNITQDGSTALSAYKAAGYWIPGWDDSEGLQSLSAWAGGTFVPDLGPWGGVIVGMNGHCQNNSSALHHFDLATGTWKEPIGKPQLHRCVAPDYAPPPSDAEVWYDPDNHEKLPVIAGGGVLSASDKPFHQGSHSFRYWPPKFGLRYNTNVSAGMRYDQWVYVPPTVGGEAAGTVAFLAPDPVHYFNSGGASGHVWMFGLTSKTWLPHSINCVRDLKAYNLGWGTTGYSALSEKYRKAYCCRADRENMVVWDLPTNSVTSQQGGSSAIFPSEGTAIVTNDHPDAHLFITVGGSRRGNDVGFSVTDLDEVAAQNNINKPVEAWAVHNCDAKAGALNRQLKLLTPGVEFHGGWSLAWSKKRQKLILFQTNYENGAHVTKGEPRPYTLHVITIPEGKDAQGKPKWQTEPWPTEQIKLTLGANTPGLMVSTTPHVYKRFSWSDPLDCAILVGSPQSLPVQAITLDDEKK